MVTWTRSVPQRYEADVAVVGGGMAGVCAAAAAARSGARVILVERFGVTGGVLTTGGVANFSGQMEDQGEVFAEILADLRAWNALGHGKRSVFHYEVLAVVLQELLLRRKVELLLHTTLVDTMVEPDGRISELLLYGMSGLETLRAAVVIDASGESAAARSAGFSTLSDYYHGRWKLPMSMMYFVRHIDPKEPHPRKPSDWFGTIDTQAELPMTSIWPDGPGGNAIKIKIPQFDSTNTESLTAAEIQGRRRMMEVMDYHQRVEQKPWMLDHCAPIIGIREGARIEGDYVLTVEDVQAGRAFPDGVARGTYQLDGHKPDDDQRTYILPKDQLKVPPYQIPLRSLIAKNGTNLLMAGRNLSADQLALSSARVSTSGAMMGQAAGIAAAMAVAEGGNVRNVGAQEVAAEVVRRGGVLAV